MINNVILVVWIFLFREGQIYTKLGCCSGDIWYNDNTPQKIYFAIVQSE